LVEAGAVLGMFHWNDRGADGEVASHAAARTRLLRFGVVRTAGLPGVSLTASQIPAALLLQRLDQPGIGSIVAARSDESS
jgi:hypothetical protein